MSEEEKGNTLKRKQVCFVKDNLLYDTEKSTLLHSWSRVAHMRTYYRVWKTKGGHYFTIKWQVQLDENDDYYPKARYVEFKAMNKINDIIKYLSDEGETEILCTHPEFKDHITEA